MRTKNKNIGIGIITCNSSTRFKQSIALIKDYFGVIVIVNDGEPYHQELYPAFAHWIQHKQNYSVAKSKNDDIKI